MSDIIVDSGYSFTSGRDKRGSKISAVSFHNADSINSVKDNVEGTYSDSDRSKNLNNIVKINMRNKANNNENNE